MVFCVRCRVGVPVLTWLVNSSNAAVYMGSSKTGGMGSTRTDTIIEELRGGLPPSCQGTSGPSIRIRLSIPVCSSYSGSDAQLHLQTDAQTLYADEVPCQRMDEEEVTLGGGGGVT